MTVASSTVYQIPGILSSIELYASAYGDFGLTAQEVLGKIICDAEGQMNAFATKETERVAGEVGLFLRNVRKAAKDTGATKNTTGEGGVKHSIQFTKNMSWEEQINRALYKEKPLRRNDTLVVGSIEEYLINDGIEDIPLAIPMSVITKAGGGRDISHSIKRGKIAKLRDGIKNAPIVIVNPDRNAIVYVTNVKQGGFPIVVAFDKNSMFDGDNVHKATSIHLQIDVQTMLDHLPNSATVYVKNKNELETVGATNNLRGLAANIKFIEEIVTQQEKNVKKEHSREMQSMEELRRVNRALERKLETVQRQAAREIQNVKEAHGITRTPTANRDDVAAVARRLLRDYGSKSKQWFIREELQKIADAIIGDQNADFSALRDQAKGIADNILQGASYDINWDLADIKKEFKDSPMYKNGCRQESYQGNEVILSLCIYATSSPAPLQEP